MCGIVGHLGFNQGTEISAELICKWNDLLSHRGPDSQGCFVEGPVSLAMRRLSIVDLELGDQPMHSQDSRFVIVFNGEIYNHSEIRRNLAAKGYKFKSKSDTEVILASFMDQGPDCLKQFNGMFALAIWDRRNRELFLARDRLGIKPLYYVVSDKRLMFSSELTPILKSGLFQSRLNHQSIKDFLSYWYLCEPNSLFEDIVQLPPGSYAVIKGKKVTQQTYWKLSADQRFSGTYSDAKEQLIELLGDSVRLRLQADVPVGTFLSGGIDSGLITALSSRIRNSGPQLKTFSIGFQDKSYSELDEARITASDYGTDASYTNVGAPSIEQIDKILSKFDEPFGNASAIPTYLIAEQASKKIKVVLTGDGGDELFGGYPTYQADYYRSFFKLIPGGVQSAIRAAIESIPVSHSRISLDYRLKQFMRGLSLSPARGHFTWREVTSEIEQVNLFREDVLPSLQGYDPCAIVDRYYSLGEGFPPKTRLMYVDLHTYLLNDHLRKVDRMTMAHSLEARVPFLDHRIVELAFSLPDKYKVQFGRTKKILRDLAKPYLDAKIVRGSKKGLTSPIASWVANEQRDYIFDTLRGGLIEQLFRQTAVDSLLDQHCTRSKDNSRIIWALLSLQVWSKRHLSS